jgi:hypothetical protein
MYGLDPHAVVYQILYVFTIFFVFGTDLKENKLIL